MMPQEAAYSEPGSYGVGDTGGGGGYPGGPYPGDPNDPQNLSELYAAVDAREQENQLLKTKLMEVSDALQQALEKQRVDQRRSKVPMKEAEAARKLKEANRMLKNYKKENAQLQGKKDTSILGQRVHDLQNKLTLAQKALAKEMTENKTLSKLRQQQEKADRNDEKARQFERDYRHVQSENKLLKERTIQTRDRMRTLEEASDKKFHEINEQQLKLKTVVQAEPTETKEQLEHQQLENQMLAEENDALGKELEEVKEAAAVVIKNQRRDKNKILREIRHLNNEVERMTTVIKTRTKLMRDKAMRDYAAPPKLAAKPRRQTPSPEPSPVSASDVELRSPSPVGMVEEIPDDVADLAEKRLRERHAQDQARKALDEELAAQADEPEPVQ